MTYSSGAWGRIDPPCTILRGERVMIEWKYAWVMCEVCGMLVREHHTRGCRYCGKKCCERCRGEHERVCEERREEV